VDVAALEEPVPACTEEDDPAEDDPAEDDPAEVEPVAAVDEFATITTPRVPALIIPNPARIVVSRRAPSRPASLTFMCCTLRSLLTMVIAAAW
jgi:hypothetical protein